MQHDAVTRTSLAALEELRQEVLATKWPDQLRDQVLDFLCTHHSPS